MAKKLKRPTKKPVKTVREQDQFVTAFDRARKGFIENWRLFAIGFVLLILIFVVVVLWMRSLERKEQHASFLLSQGITRLKEADGLSGEEASSAYNETLTVFRNLVEEYGSTESGELGLLYLGKCLSRLKRYGEAIREYERFLSMASSNQLYRSLVLRSLGFAYKNEKDYEKALACFRELAQMEGSSLGGEPILALGRVYEEMGQTEQALEAYRDFLNQYPDSTESSRIQRRAALLEKQVR